MDSFNVFFFFFFFFLGRGGFEENRKTSTASCSLIKCITSVPWKHRTGRRIFQSFLVTVCAPARLKQQEQICEAERVNVGYTSLLSMLSSCALKLIGLLACWCNYDQGNAHSSKAAALLWLLWYFTIYMHFIKKKKKSRLWSRLD